VEQSKTNGLGSRTRRTDRAAHSVIPVVTLALLAVVVWAWPFLAPNSLFWDDWLMLAYDPVEIYTITGFPWVGHAVAWLMLAGPWAVKSVSLVSTVVTVLGVFGISAHGLGLSVRERWVLAAVAIVVPLNVAHGSVGTLMLYTSCLALFVTAWRILVSGPENRRPSHRRALVATALFFISFTTSSFLVFLIVPAIHLYAITRDHERPWRSVLKLAAKYWYLPTAPVLYWILHETVFTSRGAYANYNKLRFPGSFTSPVGVGLLLCGTTFVAVVLASALLARKKRVFGITPEGLALIAAGVITAMWSAYVAWTMGNVGAAGVLVTLTLAVVALTLVVAAATRRTPALATLALTGIALVSIAYLPYLLVGKQAMFADWESRHQLLLPFGVSVLVVAGGKIVVDQLGRRPAIWGSGVLITVMAVLSASAPISLVLDWRKQEQLVESLSAHPELASAHTVEFTDFTTDWNYDARRYRFYEYTAMLSTVYGGQSRLGGDPVDVALALSGHLSAIRIDPDMYLVTDWQDDGSVTQVTITSREGADGWDLLFGRPSIELEVETAP
jgi:hypothetical protein